MEKEREVTDAERERFHAVRAAQAVRMETLKDGDCLRVAVAQIWGGRYGFAYADTPPDAYDATDASGGKQLR